MKKIGKKLAATVVTLLVVSFLVFLSFDLLPGDPALSILGTEATPARLEAMREEMGLNQPLAERYGRWVVDFVQGDMGDSYSYTMPVSEMIADKIPITLTLTILSFLMILIVSIPMGIYTTRHRGKLADRVIMAVNQVIMAVPPFFSGILITFVLGLTFRLFTPGGYVSYQDDFGKFVWYMIFPAISVALPKTAMTIRLLRTTMVEESEKDYVRTAYSRGNNTNGILYRHVLKNAMIPVVTFLGMVLTDIIASSIIIEQVYNIPGIGRILLTSIANRDYPVVEAIIVIICFLVIVVNFMVDVLYRFLDPRINAGE